MPTPGKPLEFSSKYHEQTFPERYAGKHVQSFSRRLNDFREKRLLSRALASIDSPQSIIDVGCGPGRFWSVLGGSNATTLWGLDISQTMLSFARSAQPDTRFATVAGSVTALPIRNQGFDCVVAMRLLHHFGDPAERRAALNELRRVARHNVIVSLWVDGNYKAWRRQGLERKRPERAYQNRHVFQRTAIENEFAAAGLQVCHHFDLIPGYSQWRYYVLSCQPQ